MPLAHGLWGGAFCGRPTQFEDDAENFPVAGENVVVTAEGSILVVANWDGIWPARATRLYYQRTTQDLDAPVVADAGILTPFLVRLPLRGFGRNPYLQHQDYDSAPAAPEADTLAPFQVRLPLRGLGRNPYLWHRDSTQAAPDMAPFQVRIPFKGFGRSRYLFHQDYDSAPAAPEADTLAQFLVRRPLRGLGRNPYLFHQDYDSVPAAPEADIFAPFFVRRVLRGLGRNPYLFRTAQDFSVQPEADTWIPFLVRRDITGRLRAVPAYILLPRSAQDDDAPVPPATDTLRRLLVNVGL